MHATYGTSEHLHYRLTPSLSPCKPRYLQKSNKLSVLMRKRLSKGNRAPRTIPHPRYESKATGSWTKKPGPPAYSMHTRREDCDKTPRGDPAAVQPARVKIVHGTAILEETRAHKYKPVIQSPAPGSTRHEASSQRECAVQGDPTFKSW